jgi:glycosyltransferase involved in cell wall biosynthesis
MIRFSVIVPCFNAEQFIGSCLESIVNQTVQPHEVIVIDDGSTDKSLDIIQSSRLPLRILKSPRKGGAGARNIGIRAAESEWLAFLDADDVWYPNHLERSIEIIGRFGPRGCINHYDHITLDGGLIRRECGKFDTVIEGFGLDEYIEHYLKYRHFVGMSACLVETRRALEVGGLDENQVHRHDIEFWLRAVHEQKWVFDPVATSAYRKACPGSLSKNYADATYDGFRAFLRHRDKASNRQAYESVLQKRARSAIFHSFASKDTCKLQRTYTAASGYLSRRDKLLFGFLYRFPWMFPVFRSVKLV